MSKKKKSRYTPVSTKTIWFEYDKTYSKNEEEEYARTLTQNQTPSPQYDTYYDFPLDFKSSFSNANYEYTYESQQQYEKPSESAPIERMWYLRW